MDDFREVSGMQLPHRITVEFATPLLGTMTLKVTEIELDVELEEGVFEIKGDPKKEG